MRTRSTLPLVLAGCAVAPAAGPSGGATELDTAAPIEDEIRDDAPTTKPHATERSASSRERSASTEPRGTVRCDGIWTVDLRSPGPVVAGGLLNVLQTGVVSPEENGWDEEHDLDPVNAFRVERTLVPTHDWRLVARNESTLFDCSHDGSLTFVARLYDARGELMACRVWGHGPSDVFAGRHSHRHEIHRSHEISASRCAVGPFDGEIKGMDAPPDLVPVASGREPKDARPKTDDGDPAVDDVDTADTGAP